ALHEDIWARRNYAVFNRLLENNVVEKPALVLIAENPTDRHIDYVTNEPSLDAPIIRGRFRPDMTSLNKIITSYSSRTIYVVVLNPEVARNIDHGQYFGVRFERLVEQPIIGGVAVVYRLHLKENDDNHDK
ncbi:MAG: hypothetical protein KDA84_13225, partial [Planctomycetaceae bacterium]|nr:hypothetical protein [Planctomycetaceae bacterium]